jgi:heavy metal sensor kinase
MTRAWERLPARTKLTLWHVLLMAGTLILVGAVLIWLVDRSVHQNADEFLRSRAAALNAETKIDHGKLEIDVDSDANGLIPPILRGLEIVRLWDTSHKLAYRRDGLTDVPDAAPTTLDTIATDSAFFETVQANGLSVRLYSEAVVRNGKPIAVIQVGHSETEIESLLGLLRLVGAGGLVVALVLGWFGGHFLARRALLPVERITRTAEQIGGYDLSQRLEPPLARDELGHLTAAFNEMIERLDRAFQQQRRFTSDASHELRTPLAIIRSEVEVALARKRDPSYYSRVLADVLEETERLQRLVESLLVLARADSGQALSLHPVDLGELMADVSARIAPRAHERGVQLTVMVDEVDHVRGDATWLSQVLLNLLDNALRHTPSGGRISLSLEPAPGGVVMKVADTGEGIAPEHLPRLFERFYRADRARDRRAGGTGLGLAISDWVARAHHGRLTAESRLSEGSTFTLWLPATGDGQSEPKRATEQKPVNEPVGAERS